MHRSPCAIASMSSMRAEFVHIAQQKTRRCDMRARGTAACTQQHQRWRIAVRVSERRYSGHRMDRAPPSPLHRRETEVKRAHARDDGVICTRARHAAVRKTSQRRNGRQRQIKISTHGNFSSKRSAFASEAFGCRPLLAVRPIGVERWSAAARRRGRRWRSRQNVGRRLVALCQHLIELDTVDHCLATLRLLASPLAFRVLQPASSSRQ